MRASSTPAREGLLAGSSVPSTSHPLSTTQCSGDAEAQSLVDVVLHECSTAGEDPPTQGTGLPPRPRLRPADVPRLVYAALEQGIAAAQSPADADAAASAGSGAASAGGKADEIAGAGEHGADELAGGADPNPDPAAGPAGFEEGGKSDAEARAATSAEALPVISEAIRTLQALGCACHSLALAISCFIQADSGRVHMGSAFARPAVPLQAQMQAHSGMMQPWATDDAAVDTLTMAGSLCATGSVGAGSTVRRPCSLTA